MFVIPQPPQAWNARGQHLEHGRAAGQLAVCRGPGAIWCLVKVHTGLSVRWAARQHNIPAQQTRESA